MVVLVEVVEEVFDELPIELRELINEDEIKEEVLQQKEKLWKLSVKKLLETTETLTNPDVYFDVEKDYQALLKTFRTMIAVYTKNLINQRLGREYFFVTADINLLRQELEEMYSPEENFGLIQL